MSGYQFLFDLDATITRIEILPELARQVGCFEEIRRLTEQTMRGEIPFRKGFLQRVQLLRDIPVSRAVKIVREIALHEGVADFIRDNRERCWIVTGNLDVWIDSLLDRLGMRERCLCSHARVERDRISEVTWVIDKGEAVRALAAPFVAVGDGDNDAAFIAAADVGIGFGGARPIAPSVLACADYAVYSQEKLCQLLYRLV